MAHDQTIRFSSGFMKDYQVSEVVSLRDLNEILEHETTSVDPNSIWYYQLQLLLELYQSLACIARCRYQNPWVSILSLLVFVVNVSPRNYGLIVCQLKIMLQLVLVLLELSGHPFIILYGLLDLDQLVLMFPLLEFLVLVVQVLLSQPDILSQHI